jgi:hypothetical protein
MVLVQMDGLALSGGGYAVSAAYSTVAGTVAYLPRMRKSREPNPCAFEDFRHQCVGDACPGQITDANPEFLEQAWALGTVTSTW